MDCSLNATRKHCETVGEFLLRTKITYLLGVARTAVAQEMRFPARRFLEFKMEGKSRTVPKLAVHIKFSSRKYLYIGNGGQVTESISMLSGWANQCATEGCD